MHVIPVCGVNWRDVMAGLGSFFTSVANDKESRGYDAQDATDSGACYGTDIASVGGLERNSVEVSCDIASRVVIFVVFRESGAGSHCVATDASSLIQLTAVRRYLSDCVSESAGS